MDLYDFTVTETSRWGTQPVTRGQGWSALDLMELVGSSETRNDLTITDAAGNPVRTGQIIVAARDQATNAEAWEHWSSHTAWVVLDTLGVSGPDSPREITDLAWQDAGRWWSEHVGAVPEPSVFSHVLEHLYSHDPAQLEHGVQQFVDAAMATRFRGDLADRMATAAPPRPSRIRGPLPAGDSRLTTRPTTGGAAADAAGRHATPPGRSRH